MDGRLECQAGVWDIIARVFLLASRVGANWREKRKKVAGELQRWRAEGTERWAGDGTMIPLDDKCALGVTATPRNSRVPVRPYRATTGSLYEGGLASAVIKFDSFAVDRILAVGYGTEVADATRAFGWLTLLQMILLLWRAFSVRQNPAGGPSGMGDKGPNVPTAVHWNNAQSDRTHLMGIVAWCIIAVGFMAGVAHLLMADLLSGGIEVLLVLLLVGQVSAVVYVLGSLWARALKTERDLYKPSSPGWPDHSRDDHRHG